MFQLPVSTARYFTSDNKGEKRQEGGVRESRKIKVDRNFDKTIVPIHFANSSDLVSCSQARRIMSGLELFKEVVLDFRGEVQNMINRAINTKL